MIQQVNKIPLKDRITALFKRFKWQILVLSGLVLLISFMFPRGETLKYTYEVDDVARETVIAPFNFPILKPEGKLQEDLDEALRSEPFLFVRSQEVVDAQITKLTEFFKLVEDIRRAHQKLTASTQIVYSLQYEDGLEEAISEQKSDSTKVKSLLAELKNSYSLEPDQEPWNILLESTNQLKYSLNKLEKDIIIICRGRWSEGIYDIPLVDIVSDEIIISQTGEATLHNPEEYNDLEAAWTKTHLEVNNLYPETNKILRDIGYDLAVELMKPNLIYDKTTTERRQEVRLNRVPRYQGTVLEKERIIEKNTRITTNDLLKLKSFEAVLGEAVGLHKAGNLVLEFFGKFILIAVVLSFFFTFLLIYRQSIFLDWKNILLISIIIAGIIAIAYLFAIRLEYSEYLIPVVVGAMTLTILFDARIGFMGTTATVILIGIMIGNNIDFIIVMLFTSSIAMYNVRQLRTRSQVFKSIYSLIAASIIAVMAIGFFKSESWEVMQNDLLYLVIISIIAPILTYGLIGLFEIGFDITTDLTLLELLDFNTPLIKRLQREANGTFNHSVVVGNLAEGCADAIGAHALLCRVGAYYHDIGKLTKAEYFIENQYPGQNLHDKMTWTMSARVIKNHVREGLRLADEYKLPKIVRDFIPMHHGTSRVEYFYRRAIAESEDPDKVDESSFRYPGPKPNTKETGILMIVESVEAAVRSLKEPNVKKIEEMIDRVVKSKLEEGQLDECPLTLDELRKIKGTVDGNTGMLPILRGIYHIRIEYPEEQPKPTRSSSPPSE